MATMAESRPDNVPADRVIEFDVFAPPGGESDYFAAWDTLRGKHGLIWTTGNGGHWIATDGALTRQIWGDAETFSSEALAVTPGLGEAMRFIPLQQDAPEHKPFRAAIMKGFGNNHVMAMEPVIRTVTRDLIGDLRPRDGCEFMQEFAEIVPIHVFLTLIGVPTEDRAKLRPLGQQLTRPDGTMTVEQLRDAADDYLRPYIVERLANPGQDLFSRILAIPIEGRPWTLDEAQRMCRNLLFGGLDTVVSMFGNIALHLARNPKDQALLGERPDLIPQAADELMRRYPMVSVTRNVVRDVEMDGVTLKEGDLVYLNSSIHNLDPQCFDNPLSVDFERTMSPVRHTTMGVGAHRCVGAGLARLEAILFLEEWLAAIPAFRVREGTSPTYRAGNVGAITDLRLAWD